MTEPRRSGPLWGIALKVLSVLIFVGMQVSLKSAGPLPPGQLVFFRSFFAVFPIIAVLAWRHELAGALRTAHPVSHIIRGMVGVSSMGLGFFALTLLPLPEWIALGYAQPLIVVMIGALFMGETVRLWRWGAVAVGFVGVVVISWPKLTLFAHPEDFGRGEALGVVAALSAAAISAVAVTLVRRLVHTERTATIVLWFSLTGSAAALLTLPFGWAPLSPAQATLLVLAGLCGGVAQLLMTEAYRHAPLSTVAPFEYTSIIVGTVVAFLLFDEVPTVYVAVGSAIVVASGLVIIWRESRLNVARLKARQISPPQ